MTPHLHEEQGCSLNSTQATAAGEGSSFSHCTGIHTQWARRLPPSGFAKLQEVGGGCSGSSDYHTNKRTEA